MKNYSIKKIRQEKMNMQLWNDIPPLSIECYPWDEKNYRPLTEVKLVYNNSKLMVKFICVEKNPIAKYLDFNGPVYKDSCVEFFFNPLPSESSQYINLEINSKGNFLLQIGKDKESRKFIDDVDKNIFNVISYTGPDFWSVEFEIPFCFVEKYYGKIEFKSEYKIKGNFYKCGDETVYPHYGCWNEITNGTPNFHLPQYFGELILE